jgi:M6 family metalloprotease-like protein
MLREVTRLAAFCFLLFAVAAGADVAAPVSAAGNYRLLVVAVRFPDTAPMFSMDQLRDKAGRVAGYIQNVSYGKTRIEPAVVGWHDMPAPLAEYAVSPFNYGVDRARVSRLLGDALSAPSRAADFTQYDLVWIVVGARTRPGEGYGMIAYCANPGMLSGVRGNRAALETVKLADGRGFAKPAVVSAENAHVGHVVHDLLHALGGARDGRRVVPDLYDFDMQSDPAVFKKIPRDALHPRIFAVHTGPWDIMSQHFIEWQQAPPPPSSFTRLQLGWIEPGQVVSVKAGDTREVTLQPLASGKGVLSVRVPIGPRQYLLLENRQPVGFDKVMPSHGLIVMHVDEQREEGSALVKVANANPSRGDLYGAPFRPGQGEIRYYVDPSGKIAVAPLAVERGGALRAIVTTPEHIGKYVSGQ